MLRKAEWVDGEEEQSVRCASMDGRGLHEGEQKRGSGLGALTARREWLC